MSISKFPDRKNFLPVNRNDLSQRGWKNCDFIIISGDAYVDHPSFGAAVIGRVLEDAGYKTGIIAQPDWKDPEAFKVLGRPRLGFLITSGNLDSMVNHYTSAKKRRRSDSYSPGGKCGLRPDRALIPYTSAARAAYSAVPVILGGIEASLRRLSHFDYWSGRLRRSILIDSKADLLVYGMGEKQIIEIARRLAEGEDVRRLQDIRGTVYRMGMREEEKTNSGKGIGKPLALPSFAEVSASKEAFANSFVLRYKNTNPFTAKALAEKTDAQVAVQNPPAAALSEAELDGIYSLPFTRRAHPDYESKGGIPALKEVEFSLTVNRGCYGGCSFCSLAFHQGRIIQARSISSVTAEAEKMTQLPGFKGIIHDVGGPTANFFHPACEKQRTSGACEHRECLYPEPCPNLDVDHSRYLELLRGLRELDGVKRVFIRSGIRFDYLMTAVEQDRQRGQNKECDGPGSGIEFINELCEYHVSGQLKVAPEHVSDQVLKFMKKPKNAVYQRFVREFESVNSRLGKKQYIIPYLISGHPGSGLNEAIELALYLKKQGFIPDQVQDFYPTPASLSTCMYYTGIDPFTGKKVYTAKTREEKNMQRALLHFHKPENRKIVIKALQKAGRNDLIGNSKSCLVRPAGYKRSGR
ncbi:MAG: YgiQ family radical SAM protein [Spirochaetales bacterium]|uniref:YgiQ family radical SAM protein n=1 Tax=Candidatus Thalassospirochaeta sargassi TaxID=3119039 RepID=A0AAJ1MN81_9SPIO|nr:YgiQ family radical SAM protein [Spirochaetales bacterium]